MGRWNFDRSIRAASEASIDPIAWVNALDAIADETGSMGAALLPIAQSAAPPMASASLAETNACYVAEGWSRRDLRYAAAAHAIRKGVAVDLDFIDEDGIRRSEYYQDFLGRFGLKWFAGVRVAAGPETWFLSIQRTAAQGPFDAEEQRLLAALGERLGGAATVSRAVSRARAAGLADGLEASGEAALLFDASARLAHATSRAEHLLLRGAGASRREGLTLGDRTSHPVIRAAAGAVASLGSAGAATPVVIPRPGQRPVIAYATSIPHEASGWPSNIRALVLLRDLDAEPIPDAEHLRAAFGLTPAEARVALAVARGNSVAEAAESIGVSRNTAHTQLKAAFSKLGVSRQSELASLLSRLALRR